MHELGPEGMPTGVGMESKGLKGSPQVQPQQQEVTLQPAKDPLSGNQAVI